MTRPLFMAIAAACAVAAVPAVAGTTAATEADVARSLGVPVHGVPGAKVTFVTRPPSGTPVAVSDTRRPAFGSTGPYVVLSTGDATVADAANTSPKTGTDNGGGPVRDGAERDVLVVRVDFATPVNGCVLTFHYQFLTEEFPEHGSAFDDAFVAELDLSTWTAVGGTVRAPSAFAVETAGAAAVSAATATGSTYDGGTPPRVASTVVPASGPHSLYLSVFDVRDNLYDSAVYVDNLVVGC